MICYQAINRTDPQNLLSTTLDVSLQLRGSFCILLGRLTFLNFEAILSLMEAFVRATRHKTPGESSDILQSVIMIQLTSRRILRDQEEAPEGIFYIIYQVYIPCVRVSVIRAILVCLSIALVILEQAQVTPEIIMQFQGGNRAIPLHSPPLQDCYVSEQWTQSEKCCQTPYAGCVSEHQGVCSGTLLSVPEQRLQRQTPRNCVPSYILFT